jgi:uncharacterized protein YbaP (TraB family)
MNWKHLLSVTLLAAWPGNAMVMADNVMNGPAIKAAAPVRPAPTVRASTNVALPRGQAMPALWLLADKDTKIWLFGTVHVLPENLRWQGRVLVKAMDESQELVLELSPDAMKGGALGASMLELGVSNGLPPIRGRVPADKQEALGRMIGQSGVPEQVFDRLESWAAGLTLVGVQFRQLGLSQGHGVEDVLTARFERARKPISGLETPAQQLGYFDGLGEDSQRLFLASKLEDPAALRGDFDKMIAAWARGDEQAIVASFDEEAGLSEELRDVLMRKRNARWADWLAKRLDKPGTVMVAVGAGHLAGPDSVQTLLNTRGLTTKRVQ